MIITRIAILTILAVTALFASCRRPGAPLTHSANPPQESEVIESNPHLEPAPLDNTGTIAGKVEPAEARPWVFAIAGQDTVARTRVSATGDFLLTGLDPGTYQVSLVPTHDAYSTAVISNIRAETPDTTFIGALTLNTSG